MQVITAGWRAWFHEGLRASLFLRPHAPAREPGPAQLLAMLVAAAAFELLVRRLAIPGAAEFSTGGWLASWWSIAVMVLLSWTLFARFPSADRGRPSVAAWYGLLVVASWPVIVLGGAWEFAWYRGGLPDAVLESWLAGWAFAVALWTWEVVLAARIAAALGLARRGVMLLAVCIAALCVVNGLQFTNARPWYPAAKQSEGPQAERLVLSQDLFETQQALWQKAAAGLLPQRPGLRDVYGIVFAPYGSEDVFLRESELVAGVLRDRFDAQGRVLQLVNHTSITKTLPWATPLNLRRAIEAAAGRMDREQDVLVLYLTSHGASDFKLAASHWPLEVPALTPAELRKALDDAHIRNRVIVISACYSGGWIDPLATDSSLIMTAADATHTSYGCGRRSELTYFGRALWDEQLRRTHAFQDAFAAAVPVIRQREEEARKSDGFSNPQIRVGAAIEPALAELAARLDRTADGVSTGASTDGGKVAR
jgi:hypothetical protein